MEKVGRNDPCPCGSGKKYKSCHMNSEEKRSGSNKLAMYILLFLVLVILGVAGAYFNNQGTTTGPPPGDPPPGKVWSEEHQHYH